MGASSLRADRAGGPADLSPSGSQPKALIPSASRPVLRWHGGKWKLAPWVLAHFPAHRIYVEPFGGAASVLVRKPRSYAEVYNDLDGEVVNLFRVLRAANAAEELERVLRLTPFARVEHQSAYEASEDPIERARQLIVLSFMGFGSNGHNRRRKTGFRSNSNRSGTTPAADWRNYPDCLRAFTDRLQGVVIESRDACEIMAAHDGPETLHYVDPPYMPETRSMGNKYDLTYAGGMYAHELTTDDHRKLLTFLRGLRGMVVLSGYPCALYDEVLSDWQRVERKALADGAKARTEVLWINHTAADAASNGPLFAPAREAAA